MTVAVIDVGSHTVRLLVAVREKSQDMRVLREAKAAVGLGADVERFGRISEEKLAETGAHVHSFARMARKWGAARIEILVTAPGRQSENGTGLARILQEAGGVPVRVLSPDEEGRLAFTGATHGALMSDDTVAVCDVGGGSTEVVVGTREGGPVWVRSIDIGALRLTGRMLPEDPPGAAALAAARAATESELDPFTPPLPQVALATGGTARALRKLVGSSLGPEELETVLSLLARRSSARIAKTFGIHHERARTLAAGAVILAALQQRLGVPLAVSRTGLREGAVRVMLDEAVAAA